jgi:ABC-type branched-subunit amino acid transport system ATPase component
VDTRPGEGRSRLPHDLVELQLPAARLCPIVLNRDRSKTSNSEDTAGRADTRDAVGITGPPGAGKSTLLRFVAHHPQLDTTPAGVVHLAWILVQGIGPHTCYRTYVELENERHGVQYLEAQQGYLAAGRDVVPKAVRTAIVE